MTDVDPPSYDARRATSWLVLFMTHVASCGAGAVIKSSQEPGQSYIDYTDPEFRQKLATRLGMARHRADVEAIQATREAARTAEAEADRDGSGDDSGGSGSGSSDDDEESARMESPRFVESPKSDLRSPENVVKEGVAWQESPS